MDQILVAGIRNDAADFGRGRRVGQAVVNLSLDVSLVDVSVVVELAVDGLSLLIC